MYKSAGKRCGGTLLPCLYRAGALCEAAAEEREGGNSPSSPGKGRAPLRRGQTRWLPAISFHTSKAAGGRGETLERRLPASRHLPLPHRGGVAAPSQPGGGGQAPVPVSCPRPPPHSASPAMLSVCVLAALTRGPPAATASSAPCIGVGPGVGVGVGARRLPLPAPMAAPLLPQGVAAAESSAW